MAKKKNDAKKNVKPKKDAAAALLGSVTIDEPLGGTEPSFVKPDHTVVATVPSPTDPRILCVPGTICSFGRATGDGAIDQVVGKIYRMNVPDANIPMVPPAASNGTPISENRWKIPSIPEAQAEHARTAVPQNKLAVWIHFQNNNATTYSRVLQPFIGVVHNTTFCEEV